VIGLALLFVAVLLHQASWQLTGLFRPQFVAFMQSHDRREFNPAHRIQRGRILDREGQVLAYSREEAGQVRRVYPFGPAFAHTVGYSDPRYGATGAEAAANAQLNGATPERLASWGELTRQLLIQSKRPRGQDLVLNLDARLQQLALQGLGERQGAAVLIRPRDGAVLVLANNPSFDPNWLDPVLFRGGDPATPLLNRATQGLYPPGSTFKTVMAALAIERGFAGTIPCPAEGYTTSARYPRIRDHGYYEARQGGRSFRGYGNLDLSRAFAESSNVFFAQLGVQYGLDALLETGERLQFDRKIRLYPGRDRAGNLSTGRIPRLKERDLYGLAQASIGQGRVLATPAHMAIIAAAVANGGIAMRPRLLAQDPPGPLGRFMSAPTAARLSRMMRQVVTKGTGRGIDGPELAIAGKTGTAENPRGAAHSWFVGFAPADDPTLAVAVLVEHGGYGSSAAAPIARDLLIAGQGAGEGAPIPAGAPGGDELEAKRSADLRGFSASLGD
jgi:peptidoglycan glycosyltransferase